MDGSAAVAAVLYDGGKQKENLSVEVEGGLVIVRVNAKRMFQTLANRQEIVAGVHKQLEALTQSHLKKMAEKEAVK